MPNTTLETVPMTYLRVSGERDMPGHDGLHEIDKLICRFVEFLKSQNIVYYAGGSALGSSELYGFFNPEDVVRVNAWLRENGVEPHVGISSLSSWR